MKTSAVDAVLMDMLHKLGTHCAKNNYQMLAFVEPDIVYSADSTDDRSDVLRTSSIHSVVTVDWTQPSEMVLTMLYPFSSKVREFVKARAIDFLGLFTQGKFPDVSADRRMLLITCVRLHFSRIEISAAAQNSVNWMIDSNWLPANSVSESDMRNFVELLARNYTDGSDNMLSELAHVPPEYMQTMWTWTAEAQVDDSDLSAVFDTNEAWIDGLLQTLN